MFKLSMFLHFKLTLVHCLSIHTCTCTCISAEDGLSKNRKLQNDFCLDLPVFKNSQLHTEKFGSLNFVKATIVKIKGGEFAPLEP